MKNKNKPRPSKLPKLNKESVTMKEKRNAIFTSNFEEAKDSSNVIYQLKKLLNMEITEEEKKELHYELSDEQIQRVIINIIKNLILTYLPIRNFLLSCQKLHET